MNVVIDNLLAHYTLTGKGRLVVLLHGWGDNAKGLAGLQASLSKDFQVLAVDLPGFGATEAPKTVWDLDNYAQFIQSLLAKLDLGRPYALVGHSNGGALAIRAVSLGAIKPRKLILLAASGVRTGNHLKRGVLKVIAKAGNIATWGLPERYRQALRQSLYGAAGSDMLVVPELQETFKRTVRQDVQTDAAMIDIPTLLLYAANDRAVPLDDGQRYQRLIKHSQLEVIEDAGHFVHLDQPERVLQLIEEFLA